MVEYALAIKRPFSNIRDFLIGIVLYGLPNLLAAVVGQYWVSVAGDVTAGIFSALGILTGIFVGGYLLQCAISATKQDYALPEWDMWGNLFTKGLLAFLISLIYALPFIIIAVVFIITVLGTSLGEFLSNTDPVQMLTMLGSGMVFVVLCLLVLFYILPLALLRFAATGRFSEAFSIGKIFKTAFTGQYAAAFVAMLLYNVAVFIVAGLLNYYLDFMVVTYVTSAVASFMLGVTNMTVFGEVHAEIAM